MADTSWTDEPTCPYCGHVERDAWEIHFDSIDGEVVQTCAHCGEDYHLSRNAIITYTSEPLKASTSHPHTEYPPDMGIAGNVEVES